ncbi:MAG TPA: hypothetical protein VHE37_08390 [Nevskiaceae bacterium]|nr:hypothetical protein [Nevskiaceae bacterium]
MHLEEALDMTIDKFARRNLVISERLNQIMQREQESTRDPEALLSPRLRELFAAQERLLTAAERCLGHGGLSVAR